MDTGKTFRDKTALVGVGSTDFSSMYRNLDPDRSDYDLGLQAFQGALEDSGLKKDDIDGVIVTRIASYQTMAHMLSLTQLRYVNILPAAGQMCGLAIQMAAMAVYSGMANYVACIYGNHGRSVRETYGGGGGGGRDPATWYGMTSPGASFATMWNRYLHQYGGYPEKLAAVPMTLRKHAALNPIAVMKDPFTVEDYLNTRFVAEPLRILDYCLINDGGVALIITSAERARALKKPPVYISAMANCTSIARTQYVSDDFAYAAMGSVSQRLYPAADITRQDVDCFMIYDHFSPAIVFCLEGFGFCPVGEGLDFVQGGRISIGGELPVNPNGGHLSESYMQGWAFQVEAVR
ncbi:MAG: thiolase family protein, partial [Dehalococcoidia bacterium]|nr:thiolase family protein [Dehalococcoidia bacterium]